MLACLISSGRNNLSHILYCQCNSALNSWATLEWADLINEFSWALINTRNLLKYVLNIVNVDSIEFVKIFKLVAHHLLKNLYSYLRKFAFAGVERGFPSNAVKWLC